eukprot:1232540-Pleurochrysis_carterae.AAC.1
MPVQLLPRSAQRLPIGLPTIGEHCRARCARHGRALVGVKLVATAKQRNRESGLVKDMAYPMLGRSNSKKVKFAIISSFSQTQTQAYN